MTTLTAIFQTLLNLSLTALPVMAAVLLARLCLRRAPKKYSYALWAVVGFRLLCSVSLPSPMSLFNSAPVQTTQESARIAVQQWGKTASGNSYVPPTAGIVGGNANGSSPVGNLSLGASPGPSAMEILTVIWAVGLAAMLIWAIVSYLRIRRSVRQGVLLEGGVFQCDGLKTPFVLGCFRPKIYVPFQMEAEELAHVLLHERTHLRRLDPWWKQLGFGILAVYWWNPAVWLCHFLFCRDMEMSCDEAVLREMGPEVKQSYSLSLVSFAAGRHFPAAGPLAFVENDAKSRVKNILRWKRAAPAAAFLAAALCILAAVICGTNAPTGRGWVQSAGTVSTGGRTELRFSYSVPNDINSCLFYEDVYEHGELIARNPVAYFNFNGDVNHADRRGTAELAGYIDNDFETAGWYFGWTNTNEDEIGSSAPSSIPRRTYCALAGPAYPGQNGDQIRRCLNELDAVAVLGLSDDDGRLSSPNFSSQDFSPSTLFADGVTDVAAVLRVEFSRLSAEELEQKFQEDGPGAGAAQDGNQVTLKGASKGANGSDGVGVDFDAELVKPVRSWAIYEDVYDQGVLVSSTPRISDGFSEDGTGVTSRQFSGRLLGKVSSSGGRFDGKLDCSYGESGSPAMANWTVELPLESYHASGSIMGNSGTVAGAETDTDSTISLADVHEAILITYAFSENDGVTYYSSTVNNIALANDAAVQFRLVTSVESAEGSPGRSALQLYSLKNPYVGDMVADGKLLSALNVADLGAYKLELFTSQQPYILQIDFQNEPEDPYALNNAMDGRATILLALIGNLDEVRWSYTSNGEHSSSSLNTAALNGALGQGSLPDIKTCGASLENLQALLNWLDATQSAGTIGGTGTQTAFDDILGQPGYIRQESFASGFLFNHYIAQVGGQETCIAESWGWDRDDTAVDLDGDGVKELVCNVTYGADGVQRVIVYRLAADGSVECADPLELPDAPYRDQGIGSLSEVYDAVQNTVDITYCPKGQEDPQLKSYPLDMTRLTFSPYVCSESSGQRASVPERG